MTVADMPLLDVESSPAGSTCCKTCSKDHVAHGKSGVFLFQVPFSYSFFPVPALDFQPETFSIAAPADSRN